MANQENKKNVPIYFYYLKRVCLSIEQIRVDVIRFYKQIHSEQIDAIIAAIRQLLA